MRVPELGKGGDLKMSDLSEATRDLGARPHGKAGQSILDRSFMANIECTGQDIRLKEELVMALARYNDLFIPGSQKRLKLVLEAI
jgi:hypothetical protein